MKTKDYPMLPQKQRELSESVHGTGKFDYSQLVEINSSKDKISLGCLECGRNISVRWSSHLAGTGCRKCRDITRGANRQLTDEDIRDRVEDLFGGQFTYTGGRRGVELPLECKDHGVSWMNLYRTLSGHNGCSKCNGNERISKITGEKLHDSRSNSTGGYTLDFFSESEAKFGNKFDRSKFVYVNNKTKGELFCREHSLSFWTVPQTHLTNNNGGCPMCSKRKPVSTTEKFIEDSSERFPGLFTYEKTVYRGAHTNLTITCIKHGDIEITPSNHLNSLTGCKFCGVEKRKETRTYSLEENVAVFIKVHGDKYDYSKIEIVETRVKNILCPTHGPFEQNRGDHVDGHGCPVCGNTLSKGEEELTEFLLAYFPDLEKHNRTVLNGKELDIFIPSQNFAVEYNGLYHHSEERNKDSKYHSNKTKECLEKGVFLIQIFEDEWLRRKEIVKRSLLRKLRVSSDQIYSARQTVIQKVPYIHAMKFLDETHIQGAGSPPSISIGLYKDEALVSLMCFSINGGEALLSRYCSIGLVRGGFSKLLTWFKKNYTHSIYSFSDNRWSDGGVYLNNGFTLESEVPPTYFWCKKTYRYHKRNFQLQYLPDKLGDKFDNNLTEDENCRNAGYFKVWDCGKKKWRL